MVRHTFKWQMTSSRDTRLYPICDPWLGAVGPPFERKFVPDFQNGVRGRSDEWSNLMEHLQGTDPGGMVSPSAAQLAANPNHLNASNPHAGTAPEVRKSRRGFKQRGDDLISFMRAHIPVQHIRNGIDAMVLASEMNTVDQPCLNAIPPPVAGGVPLYPVTHPLAGGVATPLSAHDLAMLQKCGNSLARHVWEYVRLQGVKKRTGLTSLTQEAAWVSLKMEHVGYKASSVMELQQLIETLNREANDKYSDDDKRIRLLSVLHSANSHADVTPLAPCGYAAVKVRLDQPLKLFRELRSRKSAL